MWHWNSLWAPAPGDPPAVDDPVLWQSPWTAEQGMALQARTWEAIVSANHSWWTMMLSVWPLLAAWPPLDAKTAAASSSDTPAHDDELAAPQEAPAAHKRSARSTRKA